MEISSEFPNSGVKRGFTLIELLVVMGLMMTMMAIAMGSFIDWGRGTGMRSSILNLKSSLVLTRQWAVTHRRKTTFTYGNTDDPQVGYYIITVNNSSGGVDTVGNTNYLAKGIVFGTNTIQNVIFNIDGSCGGAGWSGMKKKIVMQELNRGSNALISTTTVYQLTGRVRVGD